MLPHPTTSSSYFSDAALEEWVDSEEFHGSLVANVATELRSKPHHPAHEAITAHRMAMRQLLVGLAELVGAADPTALAAQLHILVEGIMADRPADAASVRGLANAALAASLP